MREMFTTSKLVLHAACFQLPLLKLPYLDEMDKHVAAVSLF